jgi:hypothetical protein
MKLSTKIGSPHDALELSAQPPELPGVFMFPKGWAEHARIRGVQVQLHAAHLNEAMEGF